MMDLIFEWDEGKALSNLQKHQVTFDEARTLFNDPLLLTYADDWHSSSEARFIGIGHSARGRLLIVIYAERTQAEGTLSIRIISSRKATSRERKTYEESRE